MKKNIDKQILEKLIQRYTLNYEEALECLLKIGHGEVSPNVISFFMAMYASRPIEVDELRGFRDALMELCVFRDLSDFNPMDVSGTGGDGKNTFNISTTAAFVIAGAGVHVAKHGNYGVSSNCGSSTLLEYLGISFSNDESFLKRCLEKSKICFMHAPLFHPAMKHVGPIRKDLGVKTFFNMLGPLVNPANVNIRLTGTYNLYLARVYHYLLESTDNQYAVLHTLDGYDEISLTSPAKVYSNQHEYLFQPEDFGFQRVEAKAIEGGKNIEASAEIFLSILKNEGASAHKKVVLANAALGISCALSISIEEAMQKAKESLEGEYALQAFNHLLSVQ